MLYNVLTIFLFIFFIINISFIYQIYSIPERKKEHSLFAGFFIIIAVNFIHLMIYCFLWVLDIQLEEYRTTPFFNIYYFSLLCYPQMLLISLNFPFPSPLTRKIRHPGLWLHLPYIFHFLLAISISLPSRIIDFLEYQKYTYKNSFTFKVIEGLSFYTFKLIDVFFSFHMLFFDYLSFIYFGLTLYILAVKNRMVYSNNLKKQTTLLLASFLVFGLFKLLINQLVQDIITGTILFTLMVMVFYLLFIINFFKYKLLSVPIFFRKGITFTLFFTLVFLVYLFFYDKLKKMVILAVGYEPTAPVVELFLTFISIIFIPLFINRLDDWLDRLSNKKNINLHRQFQIMTRELLGKLDLNEVIQLLGNMMNETLKTPFISLFIFKSNTIQIYDFPGTNQSEFRILDKEKMILKNIILTNDFVELDEIEKRLEEFGILELFRKKHIRYLASLKRSDSILGFLGISLKKNNQPIVYDEQILISMLSNQLSAVIEIANLYMESLEKARLKQELAIARDIQNALLPSVFPQSPFYQIAALNYSCLEVGGDYFDVWNLADGQLIFAIGDVSGKGAPAALLMSGVQSALRSLFLYSRDIEDIFCKLNALICQNAQGKRFITFFVGLLDPVNRQLNYINGGHNYPFLVKSDCRVITLEEGGIPLGIMTDTDYTRSVVTLDPGDLIFLYTDGISEAFNPREEEYGEERLLNCLIRNYQAHPDQIKDAVFEDVTRFTENFAQTDDITCMIVRYNQ
ncbi:MAG: SpoIIE family protein phosphatase [Candidatus Delongbacteria bacterium]|nr:SpoIIE family protein phosphatase [Candidatus Delongbacteria bacterium]